MGGGGTIPKAWKRRRDAERSRQRAGEEGEETEEEREHAVAPLHHSLLAGVKKE